MMSQLDGDFEVERVDTAAFAQKVLLLVWVQISTLK